MREENVYIFIKEMEGDDINLDYHRTDTKNYTAKLSSGKRKKNYFLK